MPTGTIDSAIFKDIFGTEAMRQVWSDGLAKVPDDDGLKTRLRVEGQALLEVVTAALSAGYQPAYLPPSSWG